MLVAGPEKNAAAAVVRRVPVLLGVHGQVSVEVPVRRADVGPEVDVREMP